MTEAILKDVSDTAFWVAHYRALETQRPDALFRDPLAALLVGEKGKKIEAQMSDRKYVAWAIVVRTMIIDAFIATAIKEGVDTVLNLGCGLDTRPYRLSFPEGFRWIEVDFPPMIAFKDEKLSNEVPRCRLERIGLDLSVLPQRKSLLAKVSAESGKVLVLTEGVTPYLSHDDVGSLAEDLRASPKFQYWVTDYSSPELMKRLMTARRNKEMKNAPFLFNPPDWTSFFLKHGWKLREMRYIGDESESLGRASPFPALAKLVGALIPPLKNKFHRMNGYALLEPS